MGVPNFANRTLYHGDNLDFLRGMNSETVKLIATDPPFNKNRTFNATPGGLAAGAKFQDRWRWKEDAHQEWIDAIQDDWPAAWAVIDWSRMTYGDDMGAFLCFMGVRLMEMHRILQEDGSLYLHCDPTASHYLKALLDAIFGRAQFRNEIIWCYTGPGSPKMRQFNRKHDVILWYAKGSTWTFNKNAVRLPHKDGGPHAGGFKGAALKPDDPSYGEKGKVPETWWTDIAIAARSSSQYLGYPTQKPLALYERIIKASSNEGDWVLDPFCGCATTPIAAENLGRRWVGIDIWDKAHETVLQRLKSVGLGDQPIKIADVAYSKEPPKRTDDSEDAAPLLKLTVEVPEPPAPKMSRAEMVDFLIKQYGMVCRGCDREFDDPLYLELDHNTPRSDGGVNHISNRLLLCSPCNRIKSNKLTLSGLRAENKKRGRMAQKA